MMKILKITATIGTAIVMLASCNSTQQKNMIELPPVPVKVAEVGFGNGSTSLSASGKIEASNSANISTRVMGYVTTLNVKMGQKVQKGQLLVSISNTDLIAQKRQAEAGVAQANAAYQNAKRDFERYKALLQKNSATPKEFDDISLRYEMAKAALETATQMKVAIVAQLSYTQITAPFAGEITNTFIKEGEMAQPGMPLLSIEGQGKLQAQVMVSEHEIAKIKNGMDAVVNVKSLDKNFKAKVVELSNSAKNTGGQYLVKLAFNQPNNELLSGMFVDAIFAIEASSDAKKQPIVSVPKSALVSKGQLSGVYVLGENNKALLRWLRIGKTDTENVEVLSGLVQGEKYVLSTTGRLFNGATVQIN